MIYEQLPHYEGKRSGSRLSDGEAKPHSLIGHGDLCTTMTPASGNLAHQASDISWVHSKSWGEESCDRTWTA